MKRLEPNLLLAISTAFAVGLVLVTTSLYGPDGSGLRNILMVVICAGAFVLLNPMLQRMMKMPKRPPMISADNPSTIVWAGLFPLLVILSAAVPVFWPGNDYGLLVIIVSIWFGVTLESALKARGLR
ncbi:hypothetical protein GCM10009422_18800 [Brevundimonas kwangchunensis]|uniref:Uncharacterized protein n=1 Tax=Brevundimonas kwangchunensis TaxID=322163 RepID=A0ABN1GXV9_9CAUL